ncbi:hypothetical protein Tco_0379538, partial [Tanacetum coccineum]
PTDVEMKPLPKHLEYSFLEKDSLLSVVISALLKDDEKKRLVSLNEATRKDHFPLPSMDQMLERLARNKFFCFLDRFFRKFQISIKPADQEKTTFTCPYGTYIYKRMPFGLCDAPVTFQRFIRLLSSKSEQMLIRCKQAHLVLNGEKCHFMVIEGIVLGQKVSSAGLEVDNAKIDVIAKLPPPTNVKAVRSFLRHVGCWKHEKCRSLPKL